MIKKNSLGILLSLLFFNLSFAKDISIQENIILNFECKLVKKIIKNSEYNYQTFSATELDDKDLNEFKIEATKPEKLFVEGLSLFLSKSDQLIVKVVNKDVVLFKALNKTTSLLTTLTINWSDFERNKDNPSTKSFSGLVASILNSFKSLSSNSVAEKV